VTTGGTGKTTGSAADRAVTLGTDAATTRGGGGWVAWTRTGLCGGAHRMGVVLGSGTKRTFVSR
jgi:hypothetical protein